MQQNWYYKVLGGHTYIRVFCNGGKCGDLVYRNDEFISLVEQVRNSEVFINFINKTDGYDGK